MRVKNEKELLASGWYTSSSGFAWYHEDWKRGFVSELVGLDASPLRKDTYVVKGFGEIELPKIMMMDKESNVAKLLEVIDSHTTNN